MNKHYLTILLSLFLGIQAYSQCENGRYRDKIFPMINLQPDIVYGQNVTYTGANQQLLLDVYTPAGDSETSRALVIMAHGGYFLAGSKTDNSSAPVCQELARMGYVASSIEYRLGVSLFGASIDASFMEAIMRAVQDMRASIRYFRKTVAEDGNPYGIDPNQIYVGGVSAGGFITLHLAYMDEDELPSQIDLTNPGLGGGMEGNSGHQSYSSAVNGIISIAGAIGDTLWIKPGDLPAFLAHGNADTVVPFDSNMLSMGGVFDIAEVDGSNSIHQKLDQVGIENCFEIYWGQDHVPQEDIVAYFDTTISIMTNFLSHLICPTTPLDCEYRDVLVSVEEQADAELTLYPNPSSDYVYLSMPDAVIIRLTDATGKSVEVRASGNTMDVSRLSSGIYFVEIAQRGKHFVRKLIVN